MLNDFIFISNVVAPVFFLVVIGIILRKLGLVDDKFVALTSKFVFNVSLPVFIFIKLYDIDLTKTFDIRLLLLTLGGILVTFFISWLIASYLKLTPENKGVFIQGAFRSNYAIVGLAIIIRMFDETALAKASLILAFALPLYNILAVIALVVPHSQ